MEPDSYLKGTFKESLRACHPEAMWAKIISNIQSEFGLKGDENQFSNSKLCVAVIGKGAHAWGEFFHKKKIEFVDSGFFLDHLSDFNADYKTRGLHFYIGDHPIPQKKSLQATNAFLDWIDSKKNAEDLIWVFVICGGSSSLLFKPRDPKNFSETQMFLEKLLKRDLSIQELNRKRSSSCVLKKGGLKAYLSKKLSSEKIFDYVVSDIPSSELKEQVAFVGGGPFYDFDASEEKDFSKNILLSPYCFVEKWASILSGPQVQPMVEEKPLQDEIQAVRDSLNLSLQALSKGQVWLFFGEAKLRIADSLIDPNKTRKGGRQSHLAALLVEKAIKESLLEKWIREGVAILLAASDGKDGGSGYAGVDLNPMFFSALRKNKSLCSELSGFIENFDTASFFEKAEEVSGGNYLLPMKATGLNVSDVYALSKGLL